ncbi:MAG: hypothetical protein Q7T04_05215 [Dehalococcoidia bacterium]|nr:hypothetical protein [Dehalococcoidia bacterium]
MPESSLAKKLQIKSNYKVAIINPPAGYVGELGRLPAGAHMVDDLDSEVDFVQLFVKDSEELEAFAPAAMQALRSGGLLWICYPKGSSKVITDLNRDTLWAAMGKYKMTGVSMVSVDDVWSAMRFRPSDEVKHKS